MHAVTTSQAAERLDVPLSTLKAWLDRLDLPLPVDSRGRRLLDDHALEVLRTVRALRDRDLGYDTIRRKLVEEGVPVGGPAAGPSAPLDGAAIAAQLTAAVHQALGEQTFLAHAYAEATREIGRLEERIAMLQGALAARDTELGMLARERNASPSADPTPDPAAPGPNVRPAWKFW